MVNIKKWVLNCYKFFKICEKLGCDVIFYVKLILCIYFNILNVN